MDTPPKQPGKIYDRKPNPFRAIQLTRDSLQECIQFCEGRLTADIMHGVVLKESILCLHHLQEGQYIIKTQSGFIVQDAAQFEVSYNEQ